MNLMVFISTKGHFGKYDIYHSTIQHLSKQINFDYFNRLVLNLKIFSDGEEAAIKIIEYFRGLGFTILVHKNNDEFFNGKNPEEVRNQYIIGNILEDMSQSFQFVGLNSSPFTFIIEDDSPIILKQKKLENYLETAKTILDDNAQVHSVHFARLMVNHQKVTQDYFYRYHKLQPENGIIKNGYWYNFQPRIHRTHDLQHAAKVIENNFSYFRVLCPEDGFQQALHAIRAVQTSQWAFDVNDAYSLHLGEVNGGTIENEAEGRLC